MLGIVVYEAEQSAPLAGLEGWRRGRNRNRKIDSGYPYQLPLAAALALAFALILSGCLCLECAGGFQRVGEVADCGACVGEVAGLGAERREARGQYDACQSPCCYKSDLLPIHFPCPPREDHTTTGCRVKGVV